MPRRFLCLGRHWLGVSLLLSSLVADALPSQSVMRGFGAWRFDTGTYDVPIVQLCILGSAIGFLRDDSRIIVQGSTRLTDAPPPPAGQSYVAFALGGGPNTSWGLALQSDGELRTWGTDGGLTAPALPPGTTYLEVSTSWDHAVALRSDGVAVAWGGDSLGQASLPTQASGVAVIQVHAGTRCTLLRLSTGAIVGFGASELASVPPLLPGMTYTNLWAGDRHAIALRSDGVYVGWGRNDYGQADVPPPPPGMTYRTVAAGGDHTVALRSDGALVSWGLDLGQFPPSSAAPGVPVVQIAGGYGNSVLLFADGEIAWFGSQDYLANFGAVAPAATWVQGANWMGLASDGTLVPMLHLAAASPALPPGMHYTALAGGVRHQLALRSDGRVLAWGNNTFGECAIPPLPPGMSYLSVDASWSRSVMLRSDGVAVECGNAGILTIPPPPFGTTYVEVSCHDDGTLLRSSDGSLLVIGGQSSSQQNVPTLPPGHEFVEVEMLRYRCAALRSDGEVIEWGSSGALLPPLPAGVVYVELSGSGDVLCARRSDGTVVASRSVSQAVFLPPPALDTNESCVGISGGYEKLVARIGPTRTYVSYAAGCGGTLPAARLVPRDTPAIGQPLQVSVFDLPLDAAVLTLGWSTVPPVSLAVIGMPGCFQHATIDAAVPLLGAHGVALFTINIPNAQALVGASFVHQAVVFDPAANAGGLVLSDAAQAVVGRP